MCKITIQEKPIRKYGFGHQIVDVPDSTHDSQLTTHGKRSLHNISCEHEYRQLLDRIKGINENIEALRKEKTKRTEMMVKYMNSDQYRKDRHPGTDEHIAACQNQEWETNKSLGKPRSQSSPGSQSSHDPSKILEPF